MEGVVSVGSSLEALCAIFLKGLDHMPPALQPCPPHAEASVLWAQPASLQQASPNAAEILLLQPPPPPAATASAVQHFALPRAHRA